VYHSDRQTTPTMGPQPKHITSGSDEFRFHECAVEFNYKAKELSNIVEIYSEVMFGKGYISKCPPDSQINVMQYLGDGRKILSVEIYYYGTKHGMLPDGFDTKYEKYSLSVSNDGKVNMSAYYYPGIVRALDSLSQLIERDESTTTDYRVKFSPINIGNDEPSYAYRGVMLDTSKEYYYPDAIKQLLDGMMIARLTVFHWHFIDSDSMPMYMKSYPDLTNYTAFRPYEIYTPEMVKDIVKHAKVRGITVIPELEGPANLNSLGYYPEFNELMACFKDRSDKSRANGPPPSAVIDPVSDKTYHILKNFMKDIKDSFEPSVWHLGGDEVKSS
jgi:N-acetyl-beta-hexosaminidase